MLVHGIPNIKTFMETTCHITGNWEISDISSEVYVANFELCCLIVLYLWLLKCCLPRTLRTQRLLMLYINLEKTNVCTESLKCTLFLTPEPRWSVKLCTGNGQLQRLMSKNCWGKLGHRSMVQVSKLVWMKMKDNFEILNWELSEEESKKISEIPRSRGCLRWDYISDRMGLYHPGYYTNLAGVFYHSKKS